MRKLIAGLVMFGSLYLAGCLADPSETAPQDDVVVLTNAHVEHHGDSTTVTGLVNGAEMSIVASEIAGQEVSSLVEPLDDGGGCLLCIINPTTKKGVCRPVACPPGL